MVDTSIAPYFDDYDVNKNYHKVLFTPRRAVQVRELNQMQSMLQEQISRFGDHVFENGSMVIPGEINYDLNYEYITVDEVDYASIVEILGTNTIKLTGANSGVVAVLVQHLSNTLTDPVTFYVRYESSNESDTPRFEVGEYIQLTTDIGIDFATSRVTGSGAGSVLTVEAGIFFINGNFIRTDDSRIVLSKYTSTPTSVAGFRLVDEVVSWTDDPSLVDNASGVSNSNAIGADRLKLSLTLEVHGLDEVFNRENFIELVQFRDGILLEKARAADYNILEDTLARRTYDESGDYTVDPFNIRLREHLKVGNNGGLYVDGDETKFVVGVEQGKAYVRGYEVDNLATRYIDVDKARVTGSINNSSFTLPVGNYIEVKSMNIIPKSSTYQKVTFYSGLPASAGAIPAGSVLGTARVRLVELKSVAGEALVYLFDIRDAAGKQNSAFINTAQSFYAAGTPALTAHVDSELTDSINYTLLYPHVVTDVKTLLTDGISDTSMTVTRQYDVVSDSNGDVILSAGADEIFVPANLSNSGASYTVSGTSTVREIASISTLSGSPTGKSMTISFGAGVATTNITIFVDVVKQVARHKTKTPTQLTITRTPGQLTNRTFALGKADAYKLVSLVENGVDKTASYTLSKNVTAETYGLSSVSLKANEAVPTNNVEITFMYFQHGTGDFFSVDSYANIDYADIPTELINGRTVAMSDVFDFRPRIDDSGVNYTGTGASITEVPSPYSLIRCDVEHYLPRVDLVYVTANKTFGVMKGVPNLNPRAPAVPDNAMAIWTLSVPAYTKDVSAVAQGFINNRRYTMRDIGKLEDRIANVEYYTTLNMLENETSGAQIIDPLTGLNRFKNGFVVDNFVDHSIGAFLRSDYSCAISPEEATLRPEFYAEGVSLDYNGITSANTVLTGSLVTLPYTEQSFIAQPLASSTVNVNPYAIYRWNGNVKLTPSDDTWFDTVYTKPEVTYSVFNNGRLTQQWNSWGLSWTGSSSSWVSGNTIVSVNTSVTVASDRVVSQDVIPFMRSREVNFFASGLLPQSKVFATFDNVNVTEHCKQNGKSYNQDMFTDLDGNINGVFKIPNTDALRFRTGAKQFTLIDNAAGDKVTALSYGDATYTAKGTLVTRTQSIAATQSITTRVIPKDPLAQSFTVNKAGGVFVTSVDLFFESKDEVVPVSIEIRNIINGYPGPDVVPYSVKTLIPSEVNVSDNASVATKFTFDSPVYLLEDQEYCFVVISNSNNYNAWVATMGQKLINSNQYISKQPFIGVLFKSQNNTAWTADQMSDLKFTVNTAKFQTNVNGVASFDNLPVDGITLDNNSLLSTNASTTMGIRIPNHGMFVGSVFSIAGVEIAPGTPITEINGDRVVTAVVDADNVQFQVVTPATVTGTFGGASVVVSRNLLMNVMQPMIQELLFENTNVDWTMNAITGKSLDGSETPYTQASNLNITPNVNNELPTPMLIASDVDAFDKLSRGSSLNLVANMITFSDNISPAIDINRLGVVAISNRINNPAVIDETDPIGGNALARYVNKIVGLKNAANSIKVFADVNKPQGSNVLMMYRTGNTEEEVENKDWVELPALVSTLATDRTTFNEFEYGIDDIASFTFFQFKAVMLSESSSKTPQIRRFRGIALGT